MSESLEDLKAIVDNAPDGATHYSVNQYDFIEGYFKLHNCNCLCYYGGKGWVDIGEDTSIDGNHYVRDISDIKRIIELMEHIKGLKANTVNFNGGVKCSDIPNNLAM